MRHPAMLYEKREDNRVHCFLCAHHCVIKPLEYGFCGVRRNEHGELYTYAYGELIANAVDPIEKKPLYHFLPGTQAYSIATPGCNFRCDFCQNWRISQAPHVSGEPSPGKGIAFDPRDIVADAVETECATIAYTYTEPTIFFEYALDTAKLAHERGVRNAFVTNGFMTASAVEAMRPYIDAANVDLKSFNDEFYRKRCSGRLKPVLETISNMREADIWVEVTTLVVPGANDSLEELEAIARFIAGVDADIPWHITRFHPDYHSVEISPTPPETIQKAAEIGARCGLRYIYPGNLPRETATYCHVCREPLIQRQRFSVSAFKLTNGACPSCNTPQAGVWGRLDE